MCLYYPRCPVSWQAKQAIHLIRSTLCLRPVFPPLACSSCTTGHRGASQAPERSFLFYCPARTSLAATLGRNSCSRSHLRAACGVFMLSSPASSSSRHHHLHHHIHNHHHHHHHHHHHYHHHTTIIIIIIINSSTIIITIITIVSIVIITAAAAALLALALVVTQQ